MKFIMDHWQQIGGILFAAYTLADLIIRLVVKTPEDLSKAEQVEGGVLALAKRIYFALESFFTFSRGK